MRLSRPTADATADDLRSYLRHLGQALEDAGVGYGEPFSVTAARPVKDPSRYKLHHHDDDQVGAAASSAASARAALANYPRTGTQRDRILRAAVAAGPHGITSDEVSQSLGIRLQSCKPRVLELRQNGWLRLSGQVRPSLAGAQVEVHVATDAAREALGLPTPAPAPVRCLGGSPRAAATLFDTAPAPVSSSAFSEPRNA